MNEWEEIDDVNEEFFIPNAEEGDFQPAPSDTQQEEFEEGNNEDYLTSFLKTKGIKDPNRIMFEDDNNQVIERSWNDLTNEEKFNILNTPTEDNVQQKPTVEYKNDLTQEEAAFLNYLRQQGVTPQQYMESLQQPVEPSYKIDDLSDDEVFLLDLESRVGELTDEQAAEALNNAKQNEEIYNKQIEGIRKEYKEREDYQSQQDQAAQELEAQEQFAQYQRVISGAIDNLTSVGNLDINLEDADKEDLAEFILSQDQNGVNYLQEALQDPQTLVKAAWFILNGDDAFNSIEDYFTDQIKKVSEAQYKKGYEDAQKGKTPTRQVVIQPKNNRQPEPPTNNGKTDIWSIDD